MDEQLEKQNRSSATCLTGANSFESVLKLIYAKKASLLRALFNSEESGLIQKSPLNGPCINIQIKFTWPVEIES